MHASLEYCCDAMVVALPRSALETTSGDDFRTAHHVSMRRAVQRSFSVNCFERNGNRKRILTIQTPGTVWMRTLLRNV